MGKDILSLYKKDSALASRTDFLADEGRTRLDDLVRWSAARLEEAEVSVSAGT
jgi:hypothetical protein